VSQKTKTKKLARASATPGGAGFSVRTILGRVRTTTTVSLSLSLPPPLLLVFFVFFPTKTMTTKAATPGVEKTAETIPPMPRGRFDPFSTLNCCYFHIFRMREHLLLFTFQGRQPYSLLSCPITKPAMVQLNGLKPLMSISRPQYLRLCF
jgi:hypothetical protein